ncbi:MAG: hypothetical protein METHP_01479 [Methanoregula sp. SKADARSKE-2]|nr:MAG: hypothetical protein METHP_01479 [Methanoregula sp. SKADARSKE-2]
MPDPGTEFLKKTQYPDFSTVDLILRVKEPPAEIPLRRGAGIIKLPNPKRFKVPDVPAREAIESYEPVPFFARSSITLKELSFLLWSCQGFKKIVSEHLQVRNIPSSGGRYPLETYFVAGEVEGLETGLYRYRPLTHTIAALRIDSDLPFELGTATMNFKVVTRAAATFIWTAVPYRSVWSLGNRGYRSVFIEAGHSCQALIMASSVIGCAVHPLDLFHDAMVSQLTGIDNETEFPVYIAAVGRVEREL